MRRLRGAIYGCGMISEFHLRGWQRIAEVDIVALGNRTLERAEKRRDEFAPDARVYNELPDLLENESLDFLDVLTPPSLHREHCLPALHAGLNVICQKPIAETLDDARVLVTAADTSQGTLSIHENHRYRPWFEEILQRARAGFFGTIRYVRFEQFDPREPPEAYKAQADYGVLLEYGTHLIDMTHHLLGIPTSVMGAAQRINSRVKAESLVHLMLAYPHAAVCVDIAWKPTGLPQGSVLVVGDQGEAIFEGTMTRGDSSRFRLIAGQDAILDQKRSPFEDYVESFYRFQRDAVAAWRSGRPVPQSASVNLQVLETTIAAYQSIAEGRVVPMTDYT